MARPDRSLTFLRGYGFSVFRFPRASAQPLELIDDSGEFLTTQQLPPGDAAARALAPAAGPQHNPARGPVFLEPRGVFVRVPQ